MSGNTFLKNKQNDSRNILLILGIIAVAFNLRPAITSVGPLVSMIREDIGISNAAAGLLTTFPLLAFAVISPFAPKIAHKIGQETSVFLGLIFITIGIVIRTIEFVFTIYTGTLFIGAGIALCNVILPGIVKKHFPGKIGLMTGVYTLSMAVCAGIAPGLSVPLAEKYNLGWSMSLAIWIFLAFFAIMIWLPQIRKNNAKMNTVKRKEPFFSSIWSSSIAWQVTFFMGLQSMVYFSLFAWLPEILVQQGISSATAGWMLTLMQFSGLPANFLIPIVADRMANQKGIALGIGLLCLTGLIGMLNGGSYFIIITSIVFVGASLGAALSHSLTLIGLRSENSSQAADLSGMAQSVGYILASIGPFLLGYMYDMFNNWNYPILLLAIVAILITISGVGAGRNQFVLEKTKAKASIH